MTTTLGLEPDNEAEMKCAELLLSSYLKCEAADTQVSEYMRLKEWDRVEGFMTDFRIGLEELDSFAKAARTSRMFYRSWNNFMARWMQLKNKYIKQLELLHYHYRKATVKLETKYKVKYDDIEYEYDED